MSTNDPRRQARTAHRSSFFDELFESPATLFGTLFLAALVLPAVVPGLRDAAVIWLLEHHVVVPAVEASLTIPATSIGLDGRRVVTACLLVVALAVFTRSRYVRQQERRRREKAGLS